MKTFFLSFPKLNISLTVPDKIVADIQTAFSHSIHSGTNVSHQHEYVIEVIPDAFTLLKNGRQAKQSESCLELICLLEADIETTLTETTGDWICFHAGAVMLGETACVIPGNPDTGKTVTTFNLVEMGGVFLCEEVAPVDPETLLVHSYPQVLTFDALYAKKHMSRYPIQNGRLQIVNSRIARYYPFSAGQGPVPLKTILMPEYGPLKKPGIEKVDPGEVLTDLLGCCFPPNTDDERLFDAVIRVCNAVDLIRLRTNSMQSLRVLLNELPG